VKPRKARKGRGAERKKRRGGKQTKEMRKEL